MTEEKILQLGYWIDIAAKGVIAIGVSVSGYHLKKTSDDLEAVKMKSSENTARVMVLEATQKELVNWLERTDRKLDLLLEKARR